MMEASSSTHFRLSAHLGYLFGDLPLRARFEAAGSAGFRAIEIADPYSLSVSEFRALCEQNKFDVAQIALPNGVAGAARKGLAALPGREAEFEKAVIQSIAFARGAGCGRIHPMSGMRAPSEPAPEWDVYLSNLAKACLLAADEGLCVIIEPISAAGAPNYFMNSLSQALRALDLIAASNLRISLDTYHGAAMGENLASFVRKNSARIGHVQVADWPRRDEPGSGEVNFAELFTALRASGYSGYLGLEYIPSLPTEERFDWIRRFDAHLEPLRRPGTSPGPV